MRDCFAYNFFRSDKREALKFFAHEEAEGIGPEVRIVPLRQEQPPASAAGKRPLSSMSPTFIENDERVAILDAAGGSRIISMVLQGALEFMREVHQLSLLQDKSLLLTKSKDTSILY